MSTPFNLPAVRRDPLGQTLDRLPQFLLMLGRMQEERREGERKDELLAQRVQEFDVAQETQKRQEDRQEMVDFRAFVLRMDDKTARAAYLRGVESDNPEINKFIADFIPAASIAAKAQREEFDLEKRTRDAKLIREIHTEYGSLTEEGQRQLRNLAPELGLFVPEDTTITDALGLLEIGAALAKPLTKSETELAKLIASKRTDPAWMDRIARAEAKVAKEKAKPPAPAEAAPVEPAVTIPEGARSVLTDKGWIYTINEKVWISAETGEPITGQ